MRRIIIIVAFTLAAPAYAGPIAPPAGPVAPTHKTLTEVEPRTAINATNTPGDGTSTFIIAQSGSYYLAGDTTGDPGKRGITIDAPNVTIDLNGFTLQGPASSGDGIYSSINASSSITIKNGTVRDWGASGISFNFGFVLDQAVTIEHVTANDNGLYGIYTYSIGTIINDCAANKNGESGIVVFKNAIVSRCVAESNGFVGAFPSAGFVADSHCILTDCSAIGNAYYGFILEFVCILERCNAQINFEDGFIENGNGSKFISCAATTNLGMGYNLGGKNNIVACTAAGQGIGFALGDHSVVTDCLTTTAGTGFGGAAAVPESVQFNNCQASDGGNGFGVGSDCSFTACVANANATGFIVAANAHFQGCSAKGNTQNGFVAAANAQFHDCAANGNTQNGFVAAANAQFHDCAANGNIIGFVIDSGTLDSCTAAENSGVGFSLGSGSAATGCVARLNGAEGLVLADDSFVNDCLSTNNTGYGILIAGSRNVVRNSHFSYNGQLPAPSGSEGIFISGDFNRIDGNSVVQNNGTAMRVSGQRNFVVRTTSAFNAGGIVDAGVANTIGSAADPWANFNH